MPRFVAVYTMKPEGLAAFRARSQACSRWTAVAFPASMRPFRMESSIALKPAALSGDGPPP
jgi:hypothetical protein